MVRSWRLKPNTDALFRLHLRAIQIRHRDSPMFLYWFVISLSFGYTCLEGKKEGGRPLGRLGCCWLAADERIYDGCEVVYVFSDGVHVVFCQFGSVLLKCMDGIPERGYVSGDVIGECCGSHCSGT